MWKITLIGILIVIFLFLGLMFRFAGLYFLAYSAIQKISQDNVDYSQGFSWQEFKQIKVGDSKQEVAKLDKPFNTFSWIDDQKCNSYSKPKGLRGADTFLGAPPFSYAKYWVEVKVCLDKNNNVVSKWENYWDY